VENTNKVLIELTKSALTPQVRQSLSTVFVGQPERNYRAYFNRLWTRFGKPNANHIRQNEKEMNKPWNPMERDFPDMIRQIRNGAICAHFFGAPKSNVDQLIIAEGLILDCGLFTTPYQEWRGKPTAERTWPNFQTFWDEKIALWHETTLVPKICTKFALSCALRSECTKRGVFGGKIFTRLEGFRCTNRAPTAMFVHSPCTYFTINC
jgi:hypothetical protein